MKKPNIPTVKEKSDKFAISIQNKNSQLVDDLNGNVDSLNNNQTFLFLESALEVEIGRKITTENSRKLSRATKDLTIKLCRMVIKSIRNKIKMVELSKTCSMCVLLIPVVG